MSKLDPCQVIFLLSWKGIWKTKNSITTLKAEVSTHSQTWAASHFWGLRCLRVSRLFINQTLDGVDSRTMVFPNNILWQSVVFDRGMIVAAALPFKTPPTPWGNFAGQREEPQGLCSKEQGGKESWQESLFPKPFDYVTRSVVEQEGNNHCNSKRLAWIQTVLKSTTEKGGRRR